ncbi:MAG: sulfatase family protein [Anaerolineae bacterium]
MTDQLNIVFIVTDNQSAWTLGCYGNEEIHTPNIDRLAAEGARFANAFSVNPVCSPNRATLLTGLIPSQHGVHNWLGTEKPDAQMGPDAYCTISELVTLPQTLADAGWTCGMSGKWHLGDSLNPQLGFEYWFAKPRGHTKSFYDSETIWEGEVYTESRYYTHAITDHALDFLQRAYNDPFFLYVGYNGPYGLDQDLRTGHRNRYTSIYADRKLCCFPRGPAHPWLKQNRDCINNETAMRSYAAAVSGVDDGVGAILDRLDALDLVDNTLVVFTADHGLCAGHHGMWGMGDHSRPLHMFQENMNVPLILRHPERIPSSSVVERMSCNYDVFPSMLAYLGLEPQLPESPPRPGASFVPSLLGRAQRQPEAIFHEYENTRAVQTSDWKLVRRHPYGPDELYDLRRDPGERVNLIHDAGSRKVVSELTGQLTTLFGRYSTPEFDLWAGGRSKAGRPVS